MALIKEIEKADGSIVSYWKVNIDSFEFDKNQNVFGLSYKGRVSVDGYINKTARNSGKGISIIKSVEGISEEDCATILSAIDKKHACYEVIKVMEDFAGSQDDL